MTEVVLERIVPEVAMPPTQDELPCDDGVPMETARHKYQMDLLIYSLRPWLTRQVENSYVGGNMFVYFSLTQARRQDFRGPDVFVALDVPPGERKSWVVWEEGKSPDVVIELLSEQTASADKGEKKRIYQNQLKVDEYYWFDPFHPDDWAGFELRHGLYAPMRPNDRGWLISQRLGLALTRWRGVYEDTEATWLRWMTLEGEMLPTPQEALEIQRQRADAAEAEIARLRALLTEAGT
jgi:Uma2 family endonuclease